MASTDDQIVKEADFCGYGAKMIAELLKTFLDQIEGVKRSKDIEYVHKMRVTSRRLREAIPIFKSCFPKKKYRVWIQAIKRITEALGDARDADVQIEFLKKYIEGIKDEGAVIGLNLLLNSLRQRRVTLQEGVIAELKRLSSSGVVDELGDKCKALASKPVPNADDDQLYLYEQAYCSISERSSELMAREDCVEKESDIKGHHEMRICTKKFRYSMEIFSAIYPSRLQEELAEIKSLQDLVGEMHDHDVWIAMLKRLRRDPSSLNKGAKVRREEISQGLTRFLGYLKAGRHNLYLRFRELWVSVIKPKTIPTIEDKIKYDLRKVKWFESIVQKKDPMLAIISDVHGNLKALKAVMDDAASRGINAFLNAGDSVGYGPHPNKVVDIIRGKNFVNVIGNYDAKVLLSTWGGNKEKGIALNFNRRELSGSRKSYLKSLPQEIMLDFGGKMIYIAHNIYSSPANLPPQGQTDQEILKAVGKLGADVVILGHSHLGSVKKVGGITVVNPGSIGFPYDGDRRPSYAILELIPNSAKLVRVEYDVEAAAEALRKKDLPEEFAQMLLRGISLDEFKRQEAALFGERRMENVIAKAKVVAQSYYPDTTHPEQVRAMALALFDQLSSQCHLGSTDRQLLELASILHDIGFSKGRRGHHKASMRMILNDQRLPLTAGERRIIGSIVRYHRNAGPKKGHYNLSNMSRLDHRRTIALAALLRLADALDYSHNSSVKEITVSESGGRIVANCRSDEGGRLEKVAFEKKKDLFLKVFKRDIELLWQARTEKA